MDYKGLERRRYPRIKASFVVNYQPLEKNKTADLSQTKNFSQGGMLLTTNKPFPKGTILKMSVRVPMVSGKLQLLGKVLDSREVAKNLIYETRIAFQNLDDKTARILKMTVRNFIEKEK